DFLPDFEGWKGGYGSDDRIHFSERPPKIIRDERAHFLCFQIISVVVTGAKHVSTEHNAALTFHAEALASRTPVHIAQRLGPVGPRSITYAIIARQVRAGLRSRNDVIAGDRVLSNWKADLLDLTS